MAQSFVDEFIPRIEQLKLSLLGDLAHILGYKPQALSYILYKIPDESKYSALKYLKSGGVRKIQFNTTKKLQRRLANLLSDCEEELFESQIKSEGDKKRYSRTGVTY